MPIELRVTPDELHLISHALSALGGKYRNEAKELLDSGKPVEASIKNEVSNAIWKLYVRLPDA